MLVREIVMNAGFTKSLTEARKAIKNKAVKINGVLVEDENAELFLKTMEMENEGEMEVIVLRENAEPEGEMILCDLTPFRKEEIVLSFGKKKHIRLNLV